MTGVTLPTAGVAGASAVLGSKVAKGTLPFTGLALGLYIALGIVLVVTGVALRVVGKYGKSQN
jgi:hypothetical protein